jgi:hypothetical protein
MRTVAICGILSCMSGCATTTWGDLMKDQTQPYINQDGRLSYAVVCEDPSVCSTIAGMRCPMGYAKSDYQVAQHDSWEFSANRWVAQGGSQSYTETRFNIVCRNNDISQIQSLLDTRK